MSWDSPRDGEDDGFLPPLPPEDRLWRHPSEIGTRAATPGSDRRSTPWAIAGTAGLIGAVLTLGVVAMLGGLQTRTVERQVVERVAFPPVAGTKTVGFEGEGGGGVVEVAERVSPSIARLEVTRSGEVGGGSGVVLRSNGYILTNAHVLADVLTVRVELADGRQFDAEIVGTDELTDIAVIHIDAEDVAPAVLGQDVELRVGEPTVAIGSPAGLQGGPSVTTGVVSALGRRVEGENEIVLHDMIQFDAPIAPGSSGGALLDARGAVIGITTAIAVTDVGVQGLGFAIPIDMARSIADELIETGEVQHALLGIKGNDLDMQSTTNGQSTEGALVVSVVEGSPAAQGGLAPGDIIVDLAGQPTPTWADLVRNLRAHEPGSEVNVSYRRDGEQHSATVVLGRR